MQSSPTKQYVLPFSQQKTREATNLEAELASVYALAEFERAKGGGLVLKQSEEKILFITEIGYPIWLYPNIKIACIFDGLNNSNYTMLYPQLPTAGSFMESLEKNSKTREDYLSFLSDFNNYFQQPIKEKEIPLNGLIVDSDFKKEFNDYHKEYREISDYPGKIALLSPILQTITISSMLTEINKLKSSSKEDAEKLSECLRAINKTTSQYVTDLNYAAEAAVDEVNAKIKAQQELVNPKIAKLNSNFKRQITQNTTNFNSEIEKLEKQKAKTNKSIRNMEQKIEIFNQKAKNQSQKNHLIYEKRWKNKSAQTKKELDGLKKDLKRIENNIKILNSQKIEKTYVLQSELEYEIKLVRQPIVQLEAEREKKKLSFKLQTETLLEREEPIINGLNRATKLAETINARFEVLGFRDQQVKSPALFYVPFYAICYQTRLNKRYIFLAPSTIHTISFTAKVRSALGISKTKERFIPRFKTVTNLIDKIQTLIKQNDLTENQITSLGEKTNLLNSDLIRNNIAKGLIQLKNIGWLSDREQQTLTNSLLHV